MVPSAASVPVLALRRESEEDSRRRRRRKRRKSNVEGEKSHRKSIFALPIAHVTYGLVFSPFEECNIL